MVRTRLPDNPLPHSLSTWHASDHPSATYDGGTTKIIDVADFPKRRWPPSI